jgi:hypothetical protein
MATKWSFEADYFTACNCDWGCPCNFNARPTQGNCVGWGAWRIDRGAYGTTKLDGAKFAVFYAFPGKVEEGNGVARTYVDEAASPAQRKALETIGTGNAGGGIFELFAKQLTKEWLPTKIVPITYEVRDGVGRVRLGDLAECESTLLSYPDGTTIRPVSELPHGIEYKRALMTNAKRWWWRDDVLLGSYLDKYGAHGRVRFDETGLVA